VWYGPFAAAVVPPRRSGAAGADGAAVAVKSTAWASALWCWTWRIRGGVSVAGQGQSAHRLTLVWPTQRPLLMRT